MSLCNMIYKKTSILLICLILFSLPYSLVYAVSLSISDISLDSKTLFPDKNTGVTIHYAVSQDAVITIRLYNQSDLCIRTLLDNIQVTAGKHEVKWNGKNDMGRLLSSGAYVYTIEAKNAGGERVLYDPADESGGLLLTVRKPLLNTKKGKISYIMPKAGMVRIRAGIKEGALLKTLVDWEPREGGRNVEKWDGRDASGLINFFNIDAREVFVFAYSLPDNSIIIKNNTAESNAVQFLSKNMPEYRMKKKIDPGTKYKHALENPALSHEPEVSLVFPETFEKDSDGTPILKGVVPVRVVVADRDKHHLESARFEVLFFVDTVFIFEDEEGFTPFTYMWDTQGLPEGEHVFTVNIMSYDDHCGVKSRKVRIRR